MGMASASGFKRGPDGSLVRGADGFLVMKKPGEIAQEEFAKYAPKTPDAPGLPPDLTDPLVQAAMDSERRKSGVGGLRASFLTGPSGVTTPAPGLKSFLIGS